MEKLVELGLISMEEGIREKGERIYWLVGEGEREMR